jgi:murein DD-endopeptidase MepM/ murein hydrolase activator NlpD
MRKSKFRYNPLTLSFERIDVPFSKKLAKIAIHFGYSLVIAAVFTVTYSFFFDTPKEKILKRNIAEAILGFEILDKRITEANTTIDLIQRRDNQIYRSIFEADTIPSTIRLGGFGGVSPYSKFEGLKNADILIRAASQLDKLSWKVYIQSKSFDEVIEMAKNKEKMVQSVPAIQPVSVKEMARISDQFGFRKDPFTRNYKKHLGVDFVGPVGVPIYATGNGTVVSAEFSFFGYGNVVVIDHGFGYKSRYAHLFKISVTDGQQVVRGQVIGELGNSGRSTGPHLHYEVLLRDNPVDPINYFNDMTSDEYELMVNNITKKGNQTHLD